MFVGVGVVVKNVMVLLKKKSILSGVGILCMKFMCREMW